MKNKRKIKLSLDQAKEMYGKNISLDEMLLANFPELGVKKVKKFEDLGLVSGWHIYNNSEIYYVEDEDACDGNRNTFAAESQAKSSLAMSQLSQLMKNVNGDWVADWSDSYQLKCVVIRADDRLMKAFFYTTYHFLAFPTSEICYQFLSDHEQLIKTYFEL